MHRVAQVGLFIYYHWKGTRLDKDYLLKTCLLHDIGNTVRLDIKNYPQFLSEEDRKKLHYWDKVVKDMVEKYGKDDHEATSKMLKEINVDPTLIQMINDMSFKNIEKIVSSSNWYPKLLLYSDLRVAPTGIVTLKERVAEVLSRRIQYTEEYKKVIFDAADALENQIQNEMNTSVSLITNESVKEYEKEIMDFEI